MTSNQSLDRWIIESHGFLATDTPFGPLFFDNTIKFILLSKNDKKEY